MEGQVQDEVKQQGTEAEPAELEAKAEQVARAELA